MGDDELIQAWHPAPDGKGRGRQMTAGEARKMEDDRRRKGKFYKNEGYEFERKPDEREPSEREPDEEKPQNEKLSSRDEFLRALKKGVDQEALNKAMEEAAAKAVAKEQQSVQQPGKDVNQEGPVVEDEGR